MPVSSPHVAIVILNYNSEDDLKVCAEQIAGQDAETLSIILVDNASRPDSLARLRHWLAGWRPDALVGTEERIADRLQSVAPGTWPNRSLLLIENADNRGYSAGNNAGIRIARLLGADAVLIANPDMRFEDPHYVRKLSRALFSGRSNMVAASRIVDLSGTDQNPLREATFAEELLWPRYLVRRWLSFPSYVLPIRSDSPEQVPKVSGCCLLLRMEFLQRIGLLDENVFLYCEEPILAAQVRTTGGTILFVPSLRAVHAHVRSEKGNHAGRMLQFIESRRYYLKTYSGYAGWKLGMLYASYAVLALLHRIRGKLTR
jgi:GT2 family glycosyltransferase